MKIFPIKCVMLGDSTVGKTSILKQFITNTMDPEESSTIGAMFVRKLIDLEDGSKVNIQFWDTAGQERYWGLIPMYVRGANFALIVYDVTNKDSFESIDRWIRFLINTPYTKFIIISNKNDLSHQKVISNMIGKQKADKLETVFFDVSARQGTNIKELFNYIIEEGKKISSEVKKDPDIINLKETEKSFYLTLKDSTEEYIDSVSNRCCNIQ